MSEPHARWIETIRRVVAEVSRSDATEFELSQGRFRVFIRRRPQEQPAAHQTAADGQPGDAGTVLVTAPLTGVFYRSPSPSTPPYVDEGDWVKPETVVGLIEAMKVFNEVTADTTGRVLAVLVPSSQLVHAGQPLLKVDPTAELSSQPEVRL